MISVIFQKRIHFSVCPAALKGIEANRINTVENSFLIGLLSIFKVYSAAGSLAAERGAKTKELFLYFGFLQKNSSEKPPLTAAQRFLEVPTYKIS